MNILEEIKDLQEKFNELFEAKMSAKRNPATKVYHNLLGTVYGKVNTKRMNKGKKSLRTDQLYPQKMNDNNSLGEGLFEGRKESESLQDYKKRLASELMSSIYDNAYKNHKNAIEVYHKKGPGEEAEAATEKAKKEYAKLKKVEGIKSNINCSFQDQIATLTEAYQSLLEEIPVEKQDISPNKIKRKKKDENGEPTEVVSVADELFPYKGTAKEQYNQKIIAKINDMIEGTATLEDLIQLVRQKKPSIKESLQETLEQMMTVAEAIKDNVKYHFTGTDGSAVFSYKGNDYSYTPGKKNNKLVKHGPTKDTRGPVTKAIDDANTVFDNARQEKYGTERLKRAANKKLNKLVKELENKEGKNSFPAKTNADIDKALKTVSNLKDKSLEADKKFTKVNKDQKKDSESGLVSGLKTEDTEIYHTKKGDGIGFKPVVKKS